MLDEPITIRFIKTRKWGKLAVDLLEKQQISYQEVEPGLIEFKAKGYISTEIIDTISRLGGHNRQLIINNEEIEWWSIFQWTWCYSISHLHPKPAYCYNPKRPNMQRSVWGCSFFTKLNIHHTTRWEPWGCWRDKYTRWEFNKEKMWNELISASSYYHLCPHFSMHRLQATFEVFPEYVELPHGWWDIRKRVVDEQGQTVVGIGLRLDLEKFEVLTKDEIIKMIESHNLKEILELDTLENMIIDKSNDMMLVIEGVQIKQGQEDNLYNCILYEAEGLAPDVIWPREAGYSKV